MTHTVHSHVVKAGRKCHNPLKGTKASYVKSGEILSLGYWSLYWDAKGAYIVSPDTAAPMDVYEFTNFNCAAAKLAELGLASV